MFKRLPAADAIRIPTGQSSAVSGLVALLDRSVVQIREAATDVRWFDRESIRAAADVWDNNLFPLFWAVSTSNAAERERRAMAVLEWMAGFSGRRRTWMSEQAAIAGYNIEPLLAHVTSYVPGRDSLGHVMTPQCQLTQHRVDDLAPDYDLATGSVRHLSVERAGTRLTAFLSLAVERTFAVDEAAPPALLNLSLDGVTDAVFDLADTQGAVLKTGEQGIEITLGTGGRLHATTGEYRLDDRSWHLSAAGRRADAATPPRTGKSNRLPPPPGERLPPDAHAAATLFRHCMWELRSVRYARRADDVPILNLCHAFSAAGEAILAAGSHRGSRRREAAFRDLIRTWADRSGPQLTRSFASILHKYAGRTELIESPQAAERTPPSLSDSPPPSHAPAEAVLVRAAWTAQHTAHHSQRPAAAQLQLALPSAPAESPAAAWRLRTVSCTDPDTFRLDTAAFHGAGRLIQTGKPTADCTLDVHQGALLFGSKDGWSASLT